MQVVSIDKPRRFLLSIFNIKRIILKNVSSLKEQEQTTMQLKSIHPRLNILTGQLTNCNKQTTAFN